MSETAQNSFTEPQLKTLKEFGKIVAVSLAHIEQVGGGDVRCCIAENYS